MRIVLRRRYEFCDILVAEDTSGKAISNDEISEDFDTS